MVSDTESPRMSLGVTAAGVIGVILYAATGVLYLGSGLVAPAPWYLFMWAIWIAGLYAVYRVFRSRRRVWTFIVAVIAAGVWYGIISAGEYFLDWTA